MNLLEMILQIILYGMLKGSVYGLIGLGMVLLGGVARLVNVAHGWFVILGAYVTYWLFKIYNLDPMLSIPLNFFLMMTIGAIYYRICAKPVIEKTMLAQVVITFGAAMCIENLVALAWTTDYRTVTPPYRVSSIDLGELKLPLVYLAVLLIVFATTLLLYFFLTRTGIGKFIRATADRPRVIQLMGVNPDKVRMLVVGLSIGLAGVAGSTISIIDTFTPSGIDYQIRAFVMLILAGFKNILNIILAGCALGIVESISTLIVPPAVSPIISYVLFISIALWRRKVGYET